MHLPSGEARRRFAEASVARLATLRADGAPHIVPVVFAVDGDRVLMAVDAKPKRSLELQRLRNVIANPAVSLLVDRYDDDWRTLWWVRADGGASVVTSGPARDEVLGHLRAKYPQYLAVSGSFGDAIIATITTWTGWSAS